MLTKPTPRTDLDLLQELNSEYIRSVQTSDVKRFEEILHEDFFCSNPDGSLVDRNQFLKQTAVKIQISNLDVEDVRIRFFGDVAIIHARTNFVLPNGELGHGRYTDVWTRSNGSWRAISAHVTRC
jgi:ketosteroid isomerase-like protein